MLRKRTMELVMGCLLLAGVFFLSKEVADVASMAVEEKQVIVLDAGHGGDDPGMIGIGQVKEKGINLSIVKKLEKLLQDQGFEVVLTREEDKGLYDDGVHNKKAQDMQRRCALIAEKKPVLTVSIHQNSYTDPAVCGPQVFYYTDSSEGAKLAKAIQDQLNNQLGIARPRVEKGNTSYYLLKKSDGVLNIVECGFLTNPEEAQLLQSEEYQQKVAVAVCSGILEYLGVNGKDKTQKSTI